MNPANPYAEPDARLPRPNPRFHGKAASEKSRDEEIGQASPTISPPPQDVPPNGGYGWACVAAVFWINAHTWGMNSSYAVFLAYYLSTDAFPGTTRLDYAFVGGLSISMALLISPLATSMVRMYGTRTALMVGLALETASFVGASFVSRTWQLFLSQGLCFGFGMGFLFVGSVGIIPQWFTTKRSFANAIGAAGSGLGGLMYSLATNTMIQNIGLPWAFRTLGICAFAVNFVCAIILKDRNKAVGSRHAAFDHTLFKRPEFILLQAFGVFSMLGYVVWLFSLPSYARSVGMTAHQGSVIGAVFNLGQAMGRPPIGYFSDAFGRINMAMAMTFLGSIFIFFVWVFAKSYGVLIFFAFIGGNVAGTYWAIVGPVTAEVVGLKHLPSALSISWVMLVAPTLFSEPIGLGIVDFNGGGYLGAQLFTGCMYLAASVCLIFLRAWKIGEVQESSEAIDKQSGTTVHPNIGSITEIASRAKSPYFKRLLMPSKV